MVTNRRSLIGGIITLAVAPAIVRASSLMSIQESARLRRGFRHSDMWHLEYSTHGGPVVFQNNLTFDEVKTILRAKQNIKFNLQSPWWSLPSVCQGVG